MSVLNYICDKKYKLKKLKKWHFSLLLILYILVHTNNMKKQTIKHF